MRAAVVGLVLTVTLSLTVASCDGDDTTTSGDAPCAAGTHRDGDRCVPDGQIGPDAAGGVDGAAPPANAKRVFVTRATYDGTLGGLSGADSLCQNAALAATLGGVWRAWLSDFDHDAVDRITGVGPWYLLTGEVAFATRGGLSTVPDVAIDVQENGERLVVGARVWTGTGAGGRAKASSSARECGEWTSIAGTGVLGNTVATDGGWTDSERLACTTRARLYCFEL